MAQLRPRDKVLGVIILAFFVLAVLGLIGQKLGLILPLTQKCCLPVGATRWAEERGLEGIVSKRRDAPYRSGECRDWRKVKTAAWRKANRERWRLFEQAK